MRWVFSWPRGYGKRRALLSWYQEIYGPVPDAGTCKRPTAGWFCTGDEGHDGPCAAWPEVMKP